MAAPYLPSNSIAPGASNDKKPLFDSQFTVVIGGGGNAAQAIAALLAVRYDVYAVSLLEGEADKWKAALGPDEYELTLDTGVKVRSKPKDITNDPAVASKADVVILLVPALAQGTYLERMAPHLKPGTVVTMLPARSGGDILFASTLREQASSMVFVGIDTLPWACRFTEWGRRVQVLGIKPSVLAAVTPAHASKKALAALQGLFGVLPYVQESPSNLGISLRNPSMVIHPGVMYGKWGSWNGKPVRERPSFYHGLDSHQEEVLAGLSSEVQRIRAKMENLVQGLDLSDACTLKEWYLEAYAGQMTDTSTLGSCMRTVSGYQGLKHPMHEVPGGFVPDLKYRYITEDIPTGLCFAKGLAEIIGVKTPMMDKVLMWAQEKLGYELLKNGRMVGKDLGKTRAPQGMGITTTAQFLQAASIKPKAAQQKKGLCRRLLAICCCCS